MKNLFQNLGSLKLAVVMLVLLLVGLASGTIVESSQGTEAAGRLVYYAWWFIALQVGFAINVACSIGVHFPWGKARAGFLTTHTALLVILIGASVSYFFKQEAHLEMWEGATSNELPFAIKLDRFTIERYQGTMQPANFRSDVEIDGVKHAIWMNHPLEHNGWTLFQSSYKQEEGRSALLISVRVLGVRVLGVAVQKGQRAFHHIGGRVELFRQTRAPSLRQLIVRGQSVLRSAQPIGIRIAGSEPARIGPVDFRGMARAQFDMVEAVIGQAERTVWVTIPGDAVLLVISLVTRLVTRLLGSFVLLGFIEPGRWRAIAGRRNRSRHDRRRASHVLQMALANQRCFPACGA